MNSDTNNGCAVFFIFVAVATAFTMMVNSCSNNGGGNYVPQVNANSFEHRYVKERVKLEGYSNKEAQQAADAIIKFHNAQQRNK